MKKTKKILAVLLAVLMLFSVSSSALAADEAQETASSLSFIYKKALSFIGKAIDEILCEGASHIPDPVKWSEQTDEGFMEGTKTFLDSPAENAVFSLGYDSRSILTSDVVGNMYVGGTINLSKKLATEIIDDLKVRTVALSDGSSRGITVLAEVDAYGLSLPDVREIRLRLADLISEKNINSITVSVLHQHSAVDTLGMNGDIFKMVLFNPASSLFGKAVENGKNQKYMENLYETCAESIEAAVSSMTEGKLYYGTADQSEYLEDKRAPYVNDANFNRFRFVPSNNTKETWLVSTEVHCVGNGAAGTAISGDYPYYAEQVINQKANANVFFYMGAQQGTTLNTDENTVENYSEEMSRIDSMKGFGKSIGNALVAITDEKEVEPLLNIKYKEVLFPVKNGILYLGAKVGLFEALVEKDGKNLYVKTEIGYMELGNDLAFAITPGELAAEIAYGGCLQSDSWTGEAWNYKSLQDIVSENCGGRKLMVIGLSNDQIGYIIPDNNFMPQIAEESQSLELVSLGSETASILVKEFEALVK